MRDTPIDRPANDGDRSPAPPADDASAELLTIDALLDGEPVDRHALRSALDDAGARDYLVEALVLRQMAREMGPTRFVIPAAPRGAVVRRLRWVAAGVIVAVSAGAGYAYGKGSRGDDGVDGDFEVVLDSRPAPAAPEPTRTIRFEPGVNWTAGDRSR
jgi:hypothetical protein